ncbi:MAG: lamin tail domain-containing protein [Bacilli bacterium]
MLELNKKEFKKNIGILLLIFLLIIISLFIKVFIFSDESQLTEKKLEKNGEVKYNKLIITEVMSSNDGAYADENGDFYDWVELYNGTSKEINLYNYGLSDLANEVKWVFPEYRIKPKEYLVVFLAGKNKEGLYANFKLNSSGGESLVLRNANGKVIDALDTVKIKKNQSLMRDLKGKWFISKKITPGFENTEEAYQKYQESLLNLSDNVIINEILPNNKGSFKDSYGEYTGYIEILNNSDKKIDLSNYTLGKSMKAPFAWKFPDIFLNPKEVIVVYTSGRDEYDKGIHASFGLENKEGNVVLGYKGKIINKVEYKDLTNGYAMIYKNKEYIETAIYSPGYPNDEDGINRFAEEKYKNIDDIIINEVMNKNNSYLAQNGNEYYDWIELKNNSKDNINLKDYYLTTEEGKHMWELPDVILKPRDYYIVMASGDVRLSNNSYKHANFKLGSSEPLYLYRNNEIIDSLFIGNVPLNNSMGRGASPGFFYISNPTPGKDNNTGYRDITKAPEPIILPGVYNNVDNVKFELKTYGTTYYTLDGSTPTKSSKVYSGPIFLNKTTVVKSMSIDSFKKESSVVTNSYIINEDHKLPVMSVSLNPNQFSNLQRKVWTVDLEYQAYAELYENGKTFSVPCGIKLFGGNARSKAKKSFALKFRGKYGASKLNYQVFENRDFSVFNSLVLRSGSTDSERAYIRDILGTSIVDGKTEVDVQAYKLVILYINGKYWGVYDIREKVDDHFISSHYNVDNSKVNVVRGDGDITAGSIRDYNSMISYARNNNLSDKQKYETIKKKLNITSYIDFWIAETFTTNNDILNMRFFSHPDIEDGRWRMILYDLDYAFYNYSKNYYLFTVDSGGMAKFRIDTSLMRSLMKNSEFKTSYLERLKYNLTNVWDEKRVLKEIDKIYNYLLPEMSRNQERWGLTLKGWQYEITELKNYIKKRKGYLLSQTKSFFDLSSSEYKKYFGDIK